MDTLFCAIDLTVGDTETVLNDADITCWIRAYLFGTVVYWFSLDYILFEIYEGELKDLAYFYFPLVRKFYVRRSC